MGQADFGFSEVRRRRREERSRMAHQLRRPLREWPLQCHCRTPPILHHLLSFPSLFSAKTISLFLPSAVPPSLHSSSHFRSYGLRLSNDGPASSHLRETSDEQDSDSKRSRNEKKREARRAVRWGMELATFSAPQIKRILRYSKHIFRRKWFLS